MGRIHEGPHGEKYEAPELGDRVMVAEHFYGSFGEPADRVFIVEGLPDPKLDPVDQIDFLLREDGTGNRETRQVFELIDLDDHDQPPAVIVAIRDQRQHGKQNWKKNHEKEDRS